MQAWKQAKEVTVTNGCSKLNLSSFFRLWVHTTLILFKMGFSGFSLMKGVGGSSVQMSSNTAWKDQAQSSGHFTFSVLFENSTGVCLATTSALLWNRNAYIAGITLLWSLLQCNFLCRQSVVLTFGVRSYQIMLVPFINLLISTELPHSVSSQVWRGSQHIPSLSWGSGGPVSQC